MVTWLLDVLSQSRILTLTQIMEIEQLCSGNSRSFAHDQSDAFARNICYAPVATAAMRVGSICRNPDTIVLFSATNAGNELVGFPAFYLGYRR